MAMSYIGGNMFDTSTLGNLLTAIGYFEGTLRHGEGLQRAESYFKALTECWEAYKKEQINETRGA